MRSTAMLLVTLAGCSSSAPTTGDAGSAPDSATAVSDGGACLSAGDDCAGQKDGCCNGNICATDPVNGKTVCATTCLSNSQCNTGCCSPLQGGTVAVCGPASYCAAACVKSGDLCSSSAPCCSSSVCVVSTVDGTRCAAKCSSSSQCVSGCCAPLNNTGQLVCSPPSFC